MAIHISFGIYLSYRCYHPQSDVGDKSIEEHNLCDQIWVTFRLFSSHASLRYIKMGIEFSLLTHFCTCKILGHDVKIMKLCLFLTLSFIIAIMFSVLGQVHGSIVYYISFM